MYGILISIAITTTLLISKYLIKKDKRNSDILWNMAPWVIVMGIIGARIYHVIDKHEYYQSNPIQTLEIWKGGLGIYGAILFGSITAIIYLKKHNQNILYYLGTLITALPLGQAIGRWGNYFNKEVYGIETSLPWGITVEGSKYHPLFLYESVLDIFLFITLMTIRTEGYRPNKIIGIYLLGYGLIRLVLEPLRPEHWAIQGINITQCISMLFFILSYILITRKDSAL